MSVTSTTYRADYVGSGTTGPFVIPFDFQDETHLLVLKTLISTGVASTLALTTDYTVDPVAKTITTTAAVTSSYKISILRQVPYTQLTEFTPGDALPASSLNNVLDLTVMQIQQLVELFTRTVTFPPQVPGTNPVLPAPVTGQVLGWDSNGNLVNQNGGATGATGAKGDTGSVWYSGSGAPAGGLGVVNDFYIDTATRNYYKKTGTSTWTSQGNLAGTTTYKEMVAYYEAAMSTSDLQPVHRVPVARSLKTVHYYMDNASRTTAGTTTILMKKNGTTVLTITLTGALAKQIMTDCNGGTGATCSVNPNTLTFAAADVITWVVSATGATPPINFSLISTFTELTT